jgi:hypothetical protein
VFWIKWVWDSLLRDRRHTSYRLSRRWKELRFVKKCWRFWNSSAHDKNHVITEDECWIYWDNYLRGR